MKIFVISLKRSEDRRIAIKSQFDALNMEFEFFDAIDGRVEPPHPLFSKYNYFRRLWFTSGKMPSKGELGVYASHYSLWKRCIELNEPFIILEDDAVVQTIFPKYVPLISDKIQDYGFLRLEAKAYKGQLHEKESGEGYMVAFLTANFDGLRCYAISPAAARQLVGHSQVWCMPVDNYVGSLYLHGMPSYILHPPVVKNEEQFETTIQLGEEKRTAFYRKPTREMYSLYKKIIMTIKNKKYENKK